MKVSSRKRRWPRTGKPTNRFRSPRSSRRSILRKKRAMRRPATERNKSTASLAVEMAKDQHIRQLEEDLKELRREHESLTHRYRQLSLQLQESTKSPRLSAGPGEASS